MKNHTQNNPFSHDIVKMVVLYNFVSCRQSNERHDLWPSWVLTLLEDQRFIMVIKYKYHMLILFNEFVK